MSTTEPDDEFDAELAAALDDNHSFETTAHNARIVATYFNTLTSEGIDPEQAVELTCQWVGVMWGHA